MNRCKRTARLYQLRQLVGPSPEGDAIVRRASKESGKYLRALCQRLGIACEPPRWSDGRVWSRYRVQAPPPSRKQPISVSI